MAAAIVPLIAGIAPSIISLITSLVHKHAPVAEAKLGSGTGPVKFADVFSSVLQALQQAAGAGAIDKTLPADDLIKLVIQAVVGSLKLQGGLDITPVSGQSVALHAGQTLTVVAS